MLVNITDIFFHINFSMYFFLRKKKLFYTHMVKKNSILHLTKIGALQRKKQNGLF